MTTRLSCEIAKKLVAAAADLGFRWNENVVGEAGYQMAYTGSCYLDLTYRSGDRLGYVGIRIADHDGAYHPGVVHIDPSVLSCAEDVARALRHMADVKRAVECA